MTKFNIENTNEYKNLLNNRTIAGIVGNRVSPTGMIPRQTIDNYFNWLKEKYPTVASSLDNLLKKKREEDLSKAVDLQQEAGIRVLVFDILEALREEIISQSRQQLDKLFAQSTLLDFQKVDKEAIKNLKIDSRVFYDTSDVIFLVNGLIEEVFLGIIPRELEKELNQEPKVELSELPVEWNIKRDELLSSICTKSVLSDLDPVKEVINEKCQELIAIIQKIRSDKNNLQHQESQNQRDQLLKKVQELTTQLQNTKELKEKIHNVAVQVNRRWVQAQIIDRQEADAVLGKDWELELSELNTLEEVKKRQTKLIEAIGQREKIEEEKQIEFKKEIQDKLEEARQFNQGTHHEDPQILLKSLEKYRSDWGSSERATPAQWRAYLEKSAALNKAIVDFNVAVACNVAIQFIKTTLGNFSPDEFLKPEHINFEEDFRKLKTKEEINQHQMKLLEFIQLSKLVRLELKEIREQSEKILAISSTSSQEESCFKLYSELKKHQDSSLDSSNLLVAARKNAFRPPLTLISLMSRLLNRVRELTLIRLSEIKEKIVKEANQSTRQAIEREFANYRTKINQAELQDLRSQRHEKEFERAAYQLLIKQLHVQQEAKIIG